MAFSDLHTTYLAYLQEHDPSPQLRKLATVCCFTMQFNTIARSHRPAGPRLSTTPDFFVFVLFCKFCIHIVHSKIYYSSIQYEHGKVLARK